MLFSLLILLPSFSECKVIERADASAIVWCPWLDNTWYYYIYHIGFYFIFGSLVPFGFLTFFCVRIITTLRAARRQPMDRHGDRLRETRVTSMVLVLLGVFIVCHVYWWIQLFCVYFLPHNTRYAYAWRTYALSVAELLITLNSSINCWIYFAFINEFRRTLCKKCCQRPGTNRAHDETTWFEINDDKWQEWYLNIYRNYFFWFVNERKCILRQGSCGGYYQWPLLLTWFNFNPSMDK